MPRFLGSNSLKARDMLIQRSVYTGYALAELDKVEGPAIEYAMIKDFQKDEKLLVGRVDRRHNPIFVNTNFLKPTTGIGSPVVLGFVSLAFKDLKAEYDKALKAGRLSRATRALSEMTVKKGYKEPFSDYSDYITSRVEEFKKYARLTGRINEITNFDTFTRVLMDFVKLTGTERPFTGSMYFLTKEVSPLISGLALEIAEGPYDNDKFKVDHFYRQSNFEYLKNIAYAYGFMIDKHVPWRLIADLNSPNMRPYIRLTYGLKAGSAVVLGLSFNKIYTDDISTVMDIMIRSYNTLVRYRPVTVTKEATATVGDSGKTIFRRCKKAKTVIREPMTMALAESIYPNSFWIDKYARIRNVETGMLYSDALLDVIVRHATDLTNALDIDAGMSYIISKFDNLEHFEGSLFHDITRLDFAEAGKTGVSVDETVRRSVQASNFVIY